MTDLRTVPLPRLPPGVITGETLQPYLELLVREILSKADVRAATGVGIAITANGNVVATLDATDEIDASIATHNAAAGAHSAAFTAQLAAHVALADPHPGYLTQAEADALYEPTASILAVTTVGALPAAAAGNKGVRTMVTDANATTFMSTVAAGGANIVPVISTGVAWVIG